MSELNHLGEGFLGILALGMNLLQLSIIACLIEFQAVSIEVVSVDDCCMASSRLNA